jgi:large subunit ribosomal protein L21
MYAVIRAGGKQYRVAPGDVIRIERSAPGQDTLEFTDVLAVSGEQGGVSRPESGARVVGRVVEEGRADKVLVFHYKRKKQYKKLRGHRQPFTAVRITEIAFDGQKFTAPDEPARKPKATKTEAVASQPTAHAVEEVKAKPAVKKSAAKNPAAKKALPKKGSNKKK